MQICLEGVLVVEVAEIFLEFSIFYGELSQHTLGNLVSSRDNSPISFDEFDFLFFEEGLSQHTLGNFVSSRDNLSSFFMGGHDDR